MVTNLARETFVLYVNDGRGNFEDQRARSGIAQATADMTGFGTAWFDYAQDGQLDLIVANSAVNTIAAQRGSPTPYRQRNQLFRNDGRGRLRQVTAEAGSAFEHLGVGRGVATGDIDNDGDLDVLVTSNGGPARLLLNETAPAHWLSVRATATSGNRWGFGGRIGLFRTGRAPMWRRIGAAGSYLSASDPRAHFGLGDSARIDRVVVDLAGWFSRALEPAGARPRARSAARVGNAGQIPMTRWIVVTLLAVCFSAPFFSTTSGAQSGDGSRRSRSTDAARAMSAGRFDDAARIYRDLLQAAPDEPGLLMNLGMALAMGGHEAEATAPLERAVALDRGLVVAHLFLGSSYLALGQPAKAIPPLERAAAARPGDIEHRRMLAQAYVAAGRAAEALTHLRRMTEIAPKLPAGWYALGHAYNTLAQDALSTFEAEPDDSPWRQLLVADALLADGRMTDAFANYRAALERLPSMVTIHDSIAEALMQLQRLEEALPMLERAVELAPADAMPRLALGRAFVQKGNFADAIPLIEPQLPGDRDGSLHVQLARAYTGIG